MDSVEFREGETLSEDSWSTVVDTKVLLVGGERPGEQLRETLETEGCSLSWAEELEEAREMVGPGTDVIVVDSRVVPDGYDRMPVPVDVADPVQVLRIDRPSPKQYRRVRQLGMDTFVRRDIGPESMLRIIEQELRRREDGEEPGGELTEAGSIFGQSEPMHRVCRLISGAAPSTASVLVTGESGVGKELVARAIHRLSPRRRRPFVALNCGAIPENLIESELFGHEEGAFTGATASREGRFAQADTGTLFLDEVGELPRPMQVKLLRVLQEQTFERVGGSEQQSVDVRIISATNRDLTVDVKRDAFRQDLFFRLNVLEIAVPPLREHRRDIDELWGHFVRKAAAQEARRPPSTSRRVIRYLYRYDWPGNVRELRNVARHAVALSNSDELRIDHLPERFQDQLARQIRNDPACIQVPGMTLEEVERATLIRTHQWADTTAETAEMLGISERKVYYKLKEYRQAGYLDEEGEETDEEVVAEEASVSERRVD
jgi:DNA-binding NtrC family response regulator